MSQPYSDSKNPARQYEYTNNNAFSAVFRYYLAAFAKMTLIYLVSTAVVLAVLSFVLANFSNPGDSLKLPLQYGTVMANSNGMFMLVIGICWPFMLSYIVGFGVTRTHSSLATLASGAIISLGLALVSSVILAVSGNQETIIFPPLTQVDHAVSLPPIIAVSISSLLCFLLGWLVALGFQFRRVVTAAGGIIAAVAAMAFCGASAIFASSDHFLVKLSLWISPYMPIIASCILIVALAICIPLLSRRIAVKS